MPSGELCDQQQPKGWAIGFSTMPIILSGRTLNWELSLHFKKHVSIITITWPAPWKYMHRHIMELKSASCVQHEGVLWHTTAGDEARYFF
jgi:hypothetical protein